MWLTFSAIALLSVTDPAQAHDAQPQAKEAPQLCAGQDAERIEIRVIRPAETFRIQPGRDDIIRSGEGFQVKRGSPIWQQFARNLCDPGGHRNQLEKGGFAPRIVVFVPGRPAHEAVSLEFPSFADNTNDVAFSSESYSGTIPSRSIRQLLDYAAKLD